MNVPGCFYFGPNHPKNLWSLKLGTYVSKIHYVYSPLMLCGIKINVSSGGALAREKMIVKYTLDLI